MKFFYLLIFLHISILPKNPVEKFISNKYKFLEFKKNMSESEWEYYEPRKRYIDKLPLKSSKDYFSQADIIIRGSILRKKFNWNQIQIIELEKFLLVADDLEFSKYFSLNEEILFSMNAKNAIQAILKLAKEDEEWRKKSDPIFFNYLKNASIEEKIFYKKNKSLFFRKESGEELISFLKSTVSN